MREWTTTTLDRSSTTSSDADLVQSVRSQPVFQHSTWTNSRGLVSVDSDTGLVNETHGLSVFDNPESVIARGFDPYEIDMESVPDDLSFIQRGMDPAHFEIVPAPGAALTPDEYISALQQIEVL